MWGDWAVEMGTGREKVESWAPGTSTETGRRWGWALETGTGRVKEEGWDRVTGIGRERGGGWAQETGWGCSWKVWLLW